MKYDLIREIASEVALEMMEEGEADQGEIVGYLHNWIGAYYGIESDPEVERIIRDVVFRTLN